ncbi:MAG: filamentous hemagglutinin N-terminal domain-containing protein, partial [Betaproteobacteria bacterium]|nr:filamentous hemagglutinin N-terminal domain-containing protein [Betaproteobacteria bacterium]
MNRFYRQVWNEARQCWMAVPETARARGKATRAARLGTLGLLMAGAFGAQAATPAATLPSGGQVVAGEAAIASAGTTMTIRQASHKAILNWQSFSIGSGAAVNFIQPGAGSVALNRVLGGDPSEIHGRLTANGQVFLINPSGVLFAPGSRVDVGGLVASTMNIRNEDFLGGRYRFSRDGSSGAVINRGEIQAQYAALLGPRVLNEGVVSAPMGSIVLAAGEAVTLGITGQSRLSVQVDQATIDTLVENRHLVKADEGTVLLSAQSAHALLGRVVNSGAVEANGISTEGGVVRLLASSSVQHSGVIRVDAGTNGKGGSAILLADLSNPASRAEVAGAISARGGMQSGDGGFIETSAAKVQIAEGLSVSTAAAQGRTGTWLIDPTDYIIAASGGNISGATLAVQLASSNITIQTPAAGAGNGDIFVNDTISWGANTTLTLSAHGGIVLNAGITQSGSSGGLTLSPAGSAGMSGTGSIASTGTVTINVSEVNDTPVARSITRKVFAGVSTVIDMTAELATMSRGATNESSQTLVMSRKVTDPTIGSISSFGATQFTYFATLGTNGTTSFQYEVIDNGTTNGAADPKTSIATITIEVLPFIPSSLKGTVFLDDDADGVYDRAGGSTGLEIPVGGVEVTLTYADPENPGRTISVTEMTEA